MEWWFWLSAGIALLVFEMLTPGGFVSFFFGVSAVLVSALVGLGLAGPPWLQWILFPVLSLAFLAFFRKSLQRVMRGKDRLVDQIVGEEAVVLDDLPPLGRGKVELRGSVWTAENTASVPLPKGQRVVVEKVEGLTLWIRPK